MELIMKFVGLVKVRRRRSAERFLRAVFGMLLLILQPSQQSLVWFSGITPYEHYQHIAIQDSSQFQLTHVQRLFFQQAIVAV
jgi:hypothetical protein